jgi:N-acetylglucosamine-6-phosphate deacetylase
VVPQLPAVTRRAIVNARLVLEDGVRPGGLLIEDGRIAALLSEAQAPPEDAERIDARRRYVAPGLIDIHVHGGGGLSLMTDDADEVRAYARWAATHGVTGFLVSTAGRDHAELMRRIEGAAPAVGVERGGARVLGFHLEGPYINPARKGAFDPRWLRSPSVREFNELHAAARGAIRQMTLAPELPGALDLIDAVVASGAVAAIGHTDATYEEALRAIQRGASHVTHTYNAMRPFGHRDPGVLGAVLTLDDMTAELIGDGAHVGWVAARVLIRAKGASRVALVTDAMPLAGTPDGEAEWEGARIRVEGGKAVRVSDGTIVGGVITLDQAVRNAVAHLPVPLHEAVAMASTVPARAMRLEGLGVLAEGAHADFIVMDDELRVVETWVGGVEVRSQKSDVGG